MPGINVVRDPYEVCQVLGKPYVGSIILQLLSGPKRFTDISRQIPEIGDSMLVYRLKELIKHGIVKKHVGTTMPTRIHYSLTPKGYALESILVRVYEWEKTWAQ